MTKLTIIHIKDCTCCESVIKIAKELVKEDAKKYHFTGSPGLRINGEDIDPLTKDAPIVLKSCKIYRTEEGMKMTPTKKMIREALEKTAIPTIKGCCG